jgi:hypothetical protein
MLSISDLHNEQELSSFEMRNVIGGEDNPAALAGAAGGAAASLGNIFSVLGCHDAAQICFDASDCGGSYSYSRCTGW